MADILIVGAGVAGLSAGIYAQMSGRRAVVCEKNPVPGGCLCGQPPFLVIACTG